MPQRGSDEKIIHYERKIKRLKELDIGRRRKIRVIYDSSDNEDIESPPPQIIQPVAKPGIAQDPDLAPDPDAVPDTNMESADPELDPDLLEALGESTSGTPEFGEKIHESLAKLWLPLLLKGLPKEKKDNLLKEYLVPDNCRLLQAPKLNAEISAAVSDSVRTRDKVLVAHQQQLGSGLAAVNKALNILLKGDDKKASIYHLSNACRIFSDLHAINTNSRIKLITPNLDKNFTHVIQDSVRDETLFGQNLSDKIKAARTIECQSLQIKKSISRSSVPQTTSHRSLNSGNWFGPSRYLSIRGNRGGKKTTLQSRRAYPSSTQQQSTSKAAEANKPHAPAPQ